jgi:hypothetical protein
MLPERHACPSCHSTETVYPVSRIYIAAITRPESRNVADWDLLRSILGHELAGSEKASERLSERLKPPAGAHHRLGPINPDYLLGGIEIVGIVYIGNAFAAHLPGLLPALGVAVGLGIVYLFLRPGLKANYNKEKAALRAAAIAYENEIHKWQSLFYCKRDDLVFSFDQVLENEPIHAGIGKTSFPKN